jgi:hypothetical protein
VYDLAKGEGENFHGSVRLGMQALLVSPNFIFRGEPAKPAIDGKKHEMISEFELASRLSYFLWSSMPDDELLTLAGKNELRKNLEAQARRMLKSPKSKALVDDFGSQWLQVRDLDSINPDTKTFKTFNRQLKSAMRTETTMFIESILKEDRPVLDFISADYSFMNQKLAEHYGIPNVTGDKFQRVSLASTNRRGVLTHGSVLTLTSNPTRTSPVKRGKWVLENLLASAPPPPPPDIPPLERRGRKVTGNLRQEMERHREDPACASCHVIMDEIGFSLENFDGVGAWRMEDDKGKIDPSGSFPSGDKFSGSVELSNLLLQTRKDDFLRCITEKMLTFALGRGIEPYDQPTIEKIAATLETKNHKFSALVMEVIQSVPFQMRRTESPGSNVTTSNHEMNWDLTNAYDQGESLAAWIQNSALRGVQE